MSLASALKKGKAFLRSGSPSSPISNTESNGGVTKASDPTSLFPKVDPAVDGEDCEHDCETCEVRLPKGWKIDESDKLYGHVNGWATHAVVATGKTDWVRDVTDEKGSVMEAIGQWTSKNEPSNGKLMLSASNLPLPDSHSASLSVDDTPTTVLLLPSFTWIDNVTPAKVPTLLTDVVSTAKTNTSPLTSTPTASSTNNTTSPSALVSDSTTTTNPDTNDSNNTASTTTTIPQLLLSKSPFPTRPCTHSAILLLCSQRTRDARCGQSAPLLKRELERHLRPLGLYRDIHDTRPGGVGVYFISHVGGHKYSANIMVYRRAGAFPSSATKSAAAMVGNGTEKEQIEGTTKAATGGENGVGGEVEGGAAQCIWLARIRPEDCEGLIKFTVLQGKVVKPERQLRGGFDRVKGLVSW